ncbi:MAG TPA: hypothetical protein PK413_04290, partial [Thermoanaerobaculia bacterium]|nr:hypothetical protein [Thermoanaerobaculia bacterium]
PGWVRWLHLLPGFAFLLPTPAWPFFVLLGLPLAEAFHWPWRHAPESLAGGPFGVGERRLRWPALEAEIAREQASLPWWQRLGSNANDLLRSRGRGRVEHEIAWAIRLRLLALPFDVAFLLAGAGTASRLLQAQPAALQLGQGAALGLGCAAVVAAGLLRLPRATRPGWGELGVLARQLGRSLLGLALGLGLAEALLLEDPRRATDVLETAALVGGLYLLASWVGSLLPPLPGDSREDDRLVIFWVGLVVLSAALGRGLESQGELGSRSWLLLLALVRWLPAWFMVTMALAVRSLFHPLPTTALRSRKLARSTRLVLFGVLLTAVAPLGGLAAPAWVWLRRHRWPLWWRQCQEASEPLSP